MQNSKQDISTEKDIELMVDSFYAKVNHDQLLSFVFNDFSKVDWNKHLPKMYRFWNTLILNKQSYKGNPFAAHVPLLVDKTHFDRWVQLFEENMDELFAGDVAEQTKLRARSIAHIFQSKLEHINQEK
ncbi:group III truncated hemoglobin [Tunicatimonas pelagia]|uniref:group III truncated hemoglobin n=1 Tax=Tunicatimonas pelagia TaxID=931531 RepID=UPI002665237C|nr:group III truncated hemoglobin [Tunicatimonas pelagia]WKN46426.1 group III truncated hemoglobin [Tunicatimonas pelagia]